MDHINPLERLILLSSDDEGRISFFQWQALGIDGNLRALSAMESTGYLRRESGTKFCRSFRLTEAGLRMKAALRTARLREIMVPQLEFENY